MNRYREKAQRTAVRLIENPPVLLRVAGRASTRVLHFASRLSSETREDMGSIIRLTRAWANGRYREIPKASLLAVVGALVYFLMPLDIIPDPILALGFLDDVVVLRYAMRYARRDLDAFLAWEADQKTPEQPPESV
jgi:uncharacterized membrane protein YkvA (DUF1232 family)